MASRPRHYFPVNKPSRLFYRSISSSLPLFTKEQVYLLSRTINAPVEDVYNVVADIAKYKEFIKFCTDSYVARHDPTSGRPTEAGLRVGFQSYDECFDCQISCQQDANKHYLVVANSLTHSLFHALQTKWVIMPHPSRIAVTQAELHLKFQFRRSLYNNVASIFGKSVTEHVMKSFERRIFMLRRQRLGKKTIQSTQGPV
ncbi:LADA_0B10022g1_1 [Lachancea dasiensis]|uniref:LADA_0B10022g1_1 n=1 Tax=Lachancea dasiensis TaxID=1072105 RepID=A0A1G4IV32_9SACH|nr:LADA_0B10022g1_1 [Lachancea dasiensis]